MLLPTRALLPLLALVALTQGFPTSSPSPSSSSSSSFLARSSNFTLPPPDYTSPSPSNASLPSIALLATGGTIAGTSSSSADSTRYADSVLGVRAVANVRAYQAANVGSESIRGGTVLRVARMVDALLCSEGSDLEGAVVRAACGVGAPLTADCDSGGRADSDSDFDGTLPALETFRAPEQGYEGAFLGARPVFFEGGAARADVGRAVRFDVRNVGAPLPHVEILYGHQDFPEASGAIPGRGGAGAAQGGSSLRARGPGAVPESAKAAAVRSLGHGQGRARGAEQQDQRGLRRARRGQRMFVARPCTVLMAVTGGVTV